MGPEQKVQSRQVLSGYRGRKQSQVPGGAKKPVSLEIKRGREKGMDNKVRHPCIRFPGPHSQDAEATTTFRGLESIGELMLLETCTGF